MKIFKKINKCVQNRERERERNVHKVLRLLEGVQIVNIDKDFEFTRNLSWSRSYHLFLRLPHLHFSTYWWSERERERDTSDKMKLWAIWATASINAKNFLFYATKTYFFYFTLSFLQNTHVNLSLYTFIQINIHFFNTVISLTDPTKPHSHLHQATTIIKPFNPTIWNPKTNNQTNNKKWIKTQKP